jgi:small ligand-binding sensory domain FIST
VLQWFSEVSTGSGALEACIGRLSERAEEPTLLVAFVSPDLASKAPERLAKAFPSATVLGCSAAGVVGGGREVEDGPMVALTAASLPDVAVVPFHMTMGRLPSLDSPPEAWHALVGVEPEVQPIFLLLPDPFTFEPRVLTGGLDDAYPDAPKIGGMASGGRRPGESLLMLGEPGRVTSHRAGAVGVALYGDVAMDTVVAQGCRPVGAPMVITRCARNHIRELDGRPVIATLESLFMSMSDHDQQLFRRSPMLGLAMQGERRPLRQGDFLIRNIQGISRRTGAMAIAAMPADGMVVQFHIRDAKTSTRDLTELLSRHQRRPDFVAPSGGLLFSCLGRGEKFYGTTGHDSKIITDSLGEIPIGGFFCNGEIGPVHGKTFLHGYTSSLGLFRPRGWS